MAVIELNDEAKRLERDLREVLPVPVLQVVNAFCSGRLLLHLPRPNEMDWHGVASRSILNTQDQGESTRCTYTEHLLERQSCAQGSQGTWQQKNRRALPISFSPRDNIAGGDPSKPHGGASVNTVRPDGLRTLRETHRDSASRVLLPPNNVPPNFVGHVLIHCLVVPSSICWVECVILRIDRLPGLKRLPYWSGEGR